MEDLVKILSKYVFCNMVLFNIISTILIGYIATFIRGDELITILAVGFFIINISYMIMISNILSRINRTKNVIDEIT